MTRLLAVIVGLVLLATSAGAAVKPAGLFTDNAVLQQGVPCPVWGTADDGEKVTVRFQGQEVSVEAAGGKWTVKLAPLQAGGPFTMTITGSNAIELKNVVVGEVWVCSGQSNMAFALARAANGAAAIAASKDPMLRLYTVPSKASWTAVTDVTGSWAECAPDVVKDFSAVGYFFGRDLRKSLNVPVGLLDSSWGGTFAQAWTSPEGLGELPQYAAWVQEEQAKKATGPNHPSVLFNGMINPLIPYPIKGAIWYQGEANAGKAHDYVTLFPGMIRSWRQAWGQGDFPFLFVQLAPYDGRPAKPLKAYSWAELREAQLLTTKNCPNTAMAVITDAGDAADIHPTRKEPVGARLALAARKLAYGQDVVFSGPVCKGKKIALGNIVLYFDHVGSGLVAKDGDLRGFAIAGADNVFVEASANIVDGNKVVVSSSRVPYPRNVRYGWINCPDVNLFNREGIPASPFRTDSLPMVTMSKG